MARVYELPTHLEVEDTLIFGLSARQLSRLLIGLSGAYLLWDNAAGWPEPLRLALAGMCVLMGLASALVRPHGRPLDRWLVVAVGFLLSPRQLAWQPSAVSEDQARAGSAWADLSPRPRWLGGTADDKGEVRW